MNNQDYYYETKYKQKASQRRKDRNGNPILMKLTFEEWYEIWLASGHIHEMGPGRLQYCMCRFSDLGHYEIGNVYIDRGLNNLVFHSGKKPTDYDTKVNELVFKTGYSRRTVRDLLAKGHRF